MNKKWGGSWRKLREFLVLERRREERKEREAVPHLLGCSRGAISSHTEGPNRTWVSLPFTHWLGALWEAWPGVLGGAPSAGARRWQLQFGSWGSLSLVAVQRQEERTCR